MRVANAHQDAQIRARAGGGGVRSVERASGGVCCAVPCARPHQAPHQTTGRRHARTRAAAMYYRTHASRTRSGARGLVRSSYPFRAGRLCTHSHDTLTPPNYQFLRLLAAFKKIVKASHTILTPNTRNEGLIDVPFSTPRVQDHRCTRTLTTSTVPTASMPRPVCPSHGEEQSERWRSRAGSPSSPIADLHAACRDPRRLPFVRINR